MADHEIRVLKDSQLRGAHALFRGTVHHPPAPDDQWEFGARSYASGRTLGAFERETLIGTAMSYPSRMAVPGHASVPMAAVSRVGVRADRTRRGVLTALMRAQLEELARKGDIVATLRASEGLIYGRFGYGVANYARSVKVNAKRAAMHPSIPVEGTVRMLERDEIVKVIPPLYERIGLHHPGMMARPEPWWEIMLRRAIATNEFLQAVVHTGPDGDDGFVLYKTESRASFDDPMKDSVVQVQDLHAASVAATVGLWRYLIGIDLVDEVQAWLRPLDEPLDLLFADLHVCLTTELADETWLRMVDVPAALAARGYGAADPVVIEVRDRVLPSNAGRYRVGPGSAERTDRPAQLELDVDVLAMLYLGAIKPSALASVGRITVHDADAPAAADRLFVGDVIPWCGTFF